MKPKPVKAPAPVILTDCIKKNLLKIKSEEWKKCFPANYKEIKYDKTHTCGYQLIIDIIKHIKQTVLTIQQIRDELLQEYTRYLPKHKDNIVDILIAEGKTKLGREIKYNRMLFTEFIQAPAYVISNLDIWIMMEKYNIPTILISSSTILQTNDTTNIFTLVSNKSASDTYIYIITSAHLNKDSILKYDLIQSDTRNIEISLSVITNEQCLRTINESIDKCVTIKDYLKHYIIIPDRANIVKKLQQKLKPIMVVEEDSDNGSEDEQIMVAPIADPTKTKKVAAPKSAKNITKKVKATV